MESEGFGPTVSCRFNINNIAGLLNLGYLRQTLQGYGSEIERVSLLNFNKPLVGDLFDSRIFKAKQSVYQTGVNCDNL